jgi:hypothetical protein
MSAITRGSCQPPPSRNAILVDFGWSPIHDKMLPMDNDVFVQSFIDVDKWNSAQWFATAFLHDPEGVLPPYIGLVFQNIDAGREIFAGWIERLGKVDEYEELRISIVEGEILGEAPGYSVHISSDPTHSEKRARANGIELKTDRAVIICRFNRMTPEPGSPHLHCFKQEYQKQGRYFVIPVSAQIEPQFEYAIEKTEIHFRQASTITATDLDAVVFPVGYFDHDGVFQ